MTLPICLWILLTTCLPVIHSLDCYWCTYSLTADGELGAGCKNDPPSTDKVYTCPADDDKCALYVKKVNGHVIDLRRYCSINCQTTCSDDDYQTDFENMADGVCYRCCRDQLCNARWEDLNLSSRLSPASVLVFLAIVMATLLR